MIDLSELTFDQDLAQPYTVNRTTGSFGQGGFIALATVQIGFLGIIQPATDEDVAQVPEADRITGMMSFISAEPMYKTRAAQNGESAGLGDTIVWRGQVYKVVHTVPWGDFGFWKAVGSRQSGA